MKVQFKSGAAVRMRDGRIAKITDYKKSFDWRIPGYLGDGFYHVIIDDITSIYDGAKFVCHEDDLEFISSSYEEKA